MSNPTKRQTEIADYLYNTCNSTADAANAFDTTEDEVLEAVVAAEIDQCACCAWWDHRDCLDGSSGDLVCDDCSGG